jgi:hypothetical protein
MDIYMPMTATIRHGEITGTLFSSVVDFIRKKEILALNEECALVHWGCKQKDDFKSLVDLKGIENHDLFAETIINDLEYVQPDLVLFKKNAYLCNERKTRTAGCPDLIIEVWSDSNSKAERNFKFELYSKSPVTEHWYIEQDKNEIVCHLGGGRIKNQFLSDILVTRDGLKFDLRYLAI